MLSQNAAARVKRSERRTDGVTIDVTMIDKEIFLSKKAARLRGFFPKKTIRKKGICKKQIPFQIHKICWQ